MGFLTPAATGEAAVAKTFVVQQLAQVRTTAFGLDDQQIRATPSASSFSIGELLRHVGATAAQWCAGVEAAPNRPEGYEGGDEALGELTAAELLAEYDERVAYVERVLSNLPPLDTPVPVPPAPWFPKDLATWEVRWVLAHLIEEIARHAGHADIVRESIDGAVAYTLNALADGKEPVQR